MGHDTEDDRDGHPARCDIPARLGDAARAVLSAQLPAPATGGRALVLGGAPDELPSWLAELGYTVDVVSRTDADPAQAGHEPEPGVRRLPLDIEDDDLHALDEDGYDLVALHSAALLHGRTRVMHGLRRRLREGGAFVVITPVAATAAPEGDRETAPDDIGIAVPAAGWERVDRFGADTPGILVLRGPRSLRATAVEKGRPAPHALTGACAVVTDRQGRILLGHSRQGMWELAGGKNAGPESFEEAAVRELAEETGLHAEPSDAHLISMVADHRDGVPRLTAVVRIAAWSGTLLCREPDRFTRWEWHDPHTLSALGPIFAPSAHALDVVWPGILPGLPPVHRYPHASAAVAVPGEPAGAIRLRAALVDAIVAGGWVRTPAVEAALRTVPRHRYAPEVPLETAYDDSLAVVTRRDGDGRALSSVSAAWLHADMIETARLAPGMRVLEIGSGGYKASLLAEIVGPAGSVVSLDIDPYVIRRARRFTAEAGYGRVRLVLGDGALGAPDHAPRTGFDAIFLTHNCWDLAPAWTAQLAEGGHLVVPLEVGGYTRAITFQRQGEVLVAQNFTVCGFVRDQGIGGRRTPVTQLLSGKAQVRFEDGEPTDTTGLDAALGTPRLDTPTGVTVEDGEPFATLQLFLATTLEGFCRLSTHRVAGDPDLARLDLPKGADAAAITQGGSLAYLTHVRSREATGTAKAEWEFVVHAFGSRARALSDLLADGVRRWDRDVRPGPGPRLTAHPAATPDAELPRGHVVRKPLSRLVFDWSTHKS